MLDFYYDIPDRKDEWDYAKVAKALKIPVEDVYAWCQSFKSDYKIIKATNEDEPTFLLYTDGDDGMMVMYHCCEVHEEGGVKMELSSRYVDIHQDTLLAMLDEFRDVAYMEYTDEEYTDED